jgi:hypothetical protein
LLKVLGSIPSTTKEGKEEKRKGEIDELSLMWYLPSGWCLVTLIDRALSLCLF